MRRCWSHAAPRWRRRGRGPGTDGGGGHRDHRRRGTARRRLGRTGGHRSRRRMGPARRGRERAATLARARAAGADGRRGSVAELANALRDRPRAAAHHAARDRAHAPRFEATAVLEAAGIAPVERDPFDTRSFPDDEYAIVPRSLADLGDDELAPMLMAWGIGQVRRCSAHEQPVPVRSSRDNGAAMEMHVGHGPRIRSAGTRGPASGPRVREHRSRTRSSGSVRWSRTPPTSSRCWTAAGVVKYVSPSAEPLLGYSPKELVGQRFAAVLRSSTSALIAQALGEQPGVAVFMEGGLRHRDGTMRAFEGKRHQPAGRSGRAGLRRQRA